LPTQQAACLPPLEAQHDAPPDFEELPLFRAVLEATLELVAEIAIENLLKNWIVLKKNEWKRVV
jgi:hypothetical protein